MKWLDSDTIESAQLTQEQKDEALEKATAFIGKLFLVVADPEKAVRICSGCRGFSVFPTAYCPHCGERSER